MQLPPPHPRARWLSCRSAALSAAACTTSGWTLLLLRISAGRRRLHAFPPEVVCASLNLPAEVQELTPYPGLSDEAALRHAVRVNSSDARIACAILKISCLFWNISETLD